MTTPRVGMRDAQTHVRPLVYSGSSAQELAKRAEQPVGVELEVRAALGDPPFSRRPARRGSRARCASRAMAFEAKARTNRPTSSDAPVRDASSRGPTTVRVRRSGGAPRGGSVAGSERDSDEAHALVEPLGADPALGPARAGRWRADTFLGAGREDEAHDEDAGPRGLLRPSTTRRSDPPSAKTRHHLRPPSRARRQEQNPASSARRRSHVRPTGPRAGQAPCAGTIASAISALSDAGISSGSSRLIPACV